MICFRDPSAVSTHLFPNESRRLRNFTANSLNKQKHVTKPKSKNSVHMLRGTEAAAQSAGRGTHDPSHQTEADKGQVEECAQRIMEMNELLHQRSVNLAEDEKYIGELTDRLRKQLQNTKRLSRLLEDTEDAARKLRTSRRWKLANPGATLKAKLSHKREPAGFGHLEKIVAAYSKWRKEHPELAKIDDEIKAAQVPKVPRIAHTESNSPVTSLPLASIRFPQHDEVEVSIVIPVFNQLEFTHAGLGIARKLCKSSRALRSS